MRHGSGPHVLAAVDVGVSMSLSGPGQHPFLRFCFSALRHRTETRSTVPISQPGDRKTDLLELGDWLVRAGRRWSGRFREAWKPPSTPLSLFSPEPCGLGRKEVDASPSRFSPGNRKSDLVGLGSGSVVPAAVDEGLSRDRFGARQHLKPISFQALSTKAARTRVIGRVYRRFIRVCYAPIRRIW